MVVLSLVRFYAICCYHKKFTGKETSQKRGFALEVAMPYTKGCNKPIDAGAGGPQSTGCPPCQAGPTGSWVVPGDRRQGDARTAWGEGGCGQPTRDLRSLGSGGGQTGRQGEMLSTTINQQSSNGHLFNT